MNILVAIRIVQALLSAFLQRNRHDVARLIPMRQIEIDDNFV